MAKRLVLHAGVHKTGSTYIQDILFNNADALASSGVRLPNSLNHRQGGLREFAFSFPEPEFQNAFRTLVLETPEDTVLVSSEELSHAIRDHHLAREFLQDLSRSHGVEVRIVAYLRRQDELRESAFQQQARRSFRGSIHEFEGYPFDYRPTVAAFREAADTVVLRPYDRRTWRRGDVFFDLLHAADITLDHPVLTPGAVNKSFDRRLIAYLASVPKARKFDRWEDVLRLRALDIIRPDGQRFLLSPHERFAFMERFNEANMEVCGDDEPLRAHLVSPPIPVEWEPPDPITPEERAAADVILAGGDKREADAAVEAMRPAPITARILRRLTRATRRLSRPDAVRSEPEQKR